MRGLKTPREGIKMRFADAFCARMLAAGAHA
jgi:hypothetical protein